MKRIARTTAIVGATLSGLVILYHLRLLAVLLLLAIALAAALRPLISRLRRLGLPRALALALVYAGVMVGFTMLVALLVPSLVTEATAVVDGFFPAYQHRLLVWRGIGGGWEMLAEWLPAPQSLSSTLSHVRPAALAGGAWWATRLALMTLASAVLVIVLSVYWSIRRGPIASTVMTLVPARHRGLLRHLTEDLGVGVGLHVFGEACKSLIALTVVALSFAMVDAPFLTVPAVLVALLRLVPLAGLALSIVTVGLVASPLGMPVALGFAAGTCALLVALDSVVPRLLRARSYNPLLVVFTGLMLANVLGWVGLLVAPAIAAAIQIIVETAADARRYRDRGGATLADLKQQHSEVRALLDVNPKTSRRTLGLARSLQRLLDEVEDFSGPGGGLLGDGRGHGHKPAAYGSSLAN